MWSFLRKNKGPIAFVLSLLLNLLGGTGVVHPVVDLGAPVAPAVGE
jgi:hypothetical protein